MQGTPEWWRMQLAEYVRWRESEGMTSQGHDDKSIVKRWIEFALAKRHDPAIRSDVLTQQYVNRPASKHPKAPDRDRSWLRQWFRWPGHLAPLKVVCR